MIAYLHNEPQTHCWDCRKSHFDKALFSLNSPFLTSNPKFLCCCTHIKFISTYSSCSLTHIPSHNIQFSQYCVLCSIATTEYSPLLSLARWGNPSFFVSGCLQKQVLLFSSFHCKSLALHLNQSSWSSLLKSPVLVSPAVSINTFS